MAEQPDPADEKDRRIATRVGVGAASIVGAIAVTTILITNAQQDVPATVTVAATADISPGQLVPSTATPARSTTTATTPVPVTRSSGSGCPGEAETATTVPPVTPAPSAAAPGPQRQAASAPMTRSRGS